MAMVANVLTAKATGANATMTVVQDAAGFCHLTIFDYD
jgi:hypothetical protein